MPTARMFFGTAVYQDRIYVMGGKVGQKATNVTEVYNPSTDKWSTKASMPIACYDLTANLVDGKIYLIGGIKPLNGSSIVCINVTQIYDPSTNKWAVGTPIPQAVYSYASAVLDRKIFVMSGSTLSPNNSITNLNQVYDAQTDTWSTQAPIPTAVNAPAGISVPSDSAKIFVIGGGGTQLRVTNNLTQIYNVHSNSWSTGASLPICSFTLAAAELDGDLYVLGGADNLTASNHVYVLHFVENSPEFSFNFFVIAGVMFVVTVIFVVKYAVKKRFASVSQIQ